jgi:NitT/TauT family transport system substrate-binding protein
MGFCGGLLRMLHGVAGLALCVSVMNLCPSAASAETIKIGLFKGISAGGPIYIAMDRGYFAAEGLDAQLLFFDAGEPIAVATVSGDVDFGAAGISAGLYNLAAQGALRVIGGMNRDVPGFHAVGFFASKRAFASGVTSMKNFAGHTSGITTIGSTYHYTLGLLEEKAQIDPKSVRVVPLQGMPNIMSALTGEQVDTAVLPIPLAAPAVQRGDFKLLGYTSDEAPWQMGLIWTSTKTADHDPDRVQRFLRAYRKGGHDYFAAFTAPDGSSRLGDGSDDILKIIAKYTSQTVAQIKPALSYDDPDARLDEADVANQVAWFHAQDMVKSAIDTSRLVDQRYALPIAAH